jgi:acyl-CoA reductase-like NAD-dependent aldehyde dehydrogenase
MFLGEFSLLDGEPRSAFAYAHTDVAARWFSRSDFESLCQQHPAIGLTLSSALGRNLTGKLRTITGQLSEYLFADEADAHTNEMVARAAAAQRVFERWPEDRVDEVLRDLAETVAGQAEALAQDCVAETGIGVAQDKVAKIRYASLGVYKVVAGQPAFGVLQTDEQTRVTEIAAPMGVVLGLIPLTNPVSTIIF